MREEFEQDCDNILAEGETVEGKMVQTKDSTGYNSSTSLYYILGSCCFLPREDNRKLVV